MVTNYYKKIMKSTFKLILIFCLLLHIGYHNVSSQSVKEKKGSSLDTLLTNKEFDIRKRRNISVKDIQSLYSEIESRRDLTLSQIDDPLTLILYYNEKQGINRRKVLLYHQQSKIIAIVNRIYSPENQIIAYKVFYFENNNHCDWYTIREANDIKSSTYTYLNGSITKSDDKLTPYIIEGEQKQFIIRSASESLDSVMHHFPTFKYTLNWK